MFVPVDYNLTKDQKLACKEAMKMKRSGKTEKQIFSKTGVSFNFDGQVNIEISDHNARLIPNPLGEIKKIKSLMSELVDKVKNEKLSLDEATIIHKDLKVSLEEQYKRYDDISNGKLDNKKLSFYLEHKDLFDLNPALADIKIKFIDSKKEKTSGYIDITESYSPYNTTIYIGREALNDANDFKYRVLHELQHIIQKEQHWSNGLSCDSFVDCSDYRFEVAMREFESLDLKEISDRIAKDSSNSNDDRSILHLLMSSLTREERAIIHNYTLCLKAGEKARDCYRSSFGEIQAYSVSERIALEPVERKKIMPFDSQKKYLKDPIYGTHTLIRKSLATQLAKKALRNRELKREPR